jgi:hypothetical protein
MAHHRHYDQMAEARLATLDPNEPWMAFEHPHSGPSGSSHLFEDISDDRCEMEIELSPHTSKDHNGYHECSFSNVDLSFSCDVLLRTTQQNTFEADSSYGRSAKPTDVAERSPRCLRCKNDGRKPQCEGAVICDCCTGFPISESRYTTLLNTPYLNWRRWAGFCDNLVKGLSHSFTPSTNPQLQNGNFILALWFEDLTCKKKLKKALSSIYQPFLTKENYDIPPLAQGAHEGPARPPAISLAHLDNFITKEMVDAKSLTPKGYEVTEHKTKLLKIVALFTGYHNLLRNLDTTWFDSSAFESDQACRIAAAEFVFALIYQLNLLYVQFATRINSLFSDHNSEKRTALAFYALEFVSLVLRSTQGVSWNISEANPSYALIQLEKEFNHQSEAILCQILTYDCIQLKIHERRRRIFGGPELLDLARPTGKKGFPSHLSVTTRRHGWLQTISEPFPVADMGFAKHSIIDILRDSDQSLTMDIIYGRLQPRKRFPEYMIENDNTKVIRGLANTRYKIRGKLSKASKTSTGGPTYDSALSMLPGLRLPPMAPNRSSPTKKKDTATLYSHTGETVSSETSKTCPIGQESLVDMNSPSEIPAIWDPKIMELFTAGDSHPEEYIPFSYDSSL